LQWGPSLTAPVLGDMRVKAAQLRVKTAAP
jgi:hypothetical protein